jgi:AraC-like DNA-binding protein
MHLTIQRLASRTHFNLSTDDAPADGDDRLIILLCNSGTTVSTPAGFAGLWWPTRGRIVASTADMRITFDRRSLFVSDSQRQQDTFVQPASGAIAVLGTQASWSAVLAAADADAVHCEPALFPALHSVGARTCRQLLSFLRIAMAARSTRLEPAKTMRLAAIVNDLQRRFEAQIARSPGRNASRQRTVFLRLQRICNYLSYSCHTHVDVGTLALMANYSVWRFIRVYDTVFGETPYAHISRCRLDRARELLDAGGQCVGDIAFAVGFENRSTLTRAMKKRFGVSASQLRSARELAHA